MKQKLMVLAMVVMALMSNLSVRAQEQNAAPAGMVETQSGTAYGYAMNEKWYVSLGVGPNLLISNQDSKGDFSDRVKFGGEISVGKWFNPGLGLRAQIYFGQYCGYNYCDIQGGTFTSGDGKSCYPAGWPNKLEYVKNHSGFCQKFYSGSFFLDFTVNFTKLIQGYNSDPTHFEIIGYIGGGYLHNIKSETNPTVDCFGGRFGGRLNYNLVKGGPWAIYLEGNGTFLPEKFDGYIGDQGYDANANVLIGVQYSF